MDSVLVHLDFGPSAPGNVRGQEAWRTGDGLLMRIRVDPSKLVYLICRLILLADIDVGLVLLIAP